MTRVGPNQDINDPTTLENLRYVASQASVSMNNALRTRDGLPVDNNYLIPIYTLMSLEDGSRTQMTGFVKEIGQFAPLDNMTDANRLLYENSLIQTHVWQPELYRYFWTTLYAYVNSFVRPVFDVDLSLDDFATEINQSQTHIVTSGWNEPFITDGIILADTSILNNDVDGLLSLKGLAPSIPTSPSTPLWSGSGPTYYYPQTYPQLENAFEILRDWANEVDDSFATQDETLIVTQRDFSKYTRTRRTGVGNWFNVGANGYDISTLTQLYTVSKTLSIHNPTNSDIDITLGGYIQWDTAPDQAADIVDIFGSGIRPWGNSLSIGIIQRIKTYAGAYEIGGTFNDVLIRDESNDFGSGSDQSDNLFTIGPGETKNLVWFVRFDLSTNIDWGTIYVQIDDHIAFGFRRNVLLGLTINAESQEYGFTALSHTVTYGV